jgi:hypothetical protein
MIRLFKLAIIRLFCGRFAADSYRWRGKILTGKYRHYCYDWDCLPVDETTPEWGSCMCLPTAARSESEDTQRASEPHQTQERDDE